MSRRRTPLSRAERALVRSQRPDGNPAVGEGTAVPARPPHAPLSEGPPGAPSSPAPAPSTNTESASTPKPGLLSTGTDSPGGLYPPMRTGVPSSAVDVSTNSSCANAASESTRGAPGDGGAA